MGWRHVMQTFCLNCGNTIAIYLSEEEYEKT